MTRSHLAHPLPVLCAAALVFALALWLRLIGTEWDGWAALHPDERHMVFVTLDMLRGLEAAEGRSAAWLWFDPASPLNPRAEGRFHVYGELPNLIVAFLARALDMAHWGGVTYVGRVASAMLDASTVLAVFMLAVTLFARSGARLRYGAALLAAGLYALAPTPLQLANFYTVDVWLATFATWALLPMLALARGRAQDGSALTAGILVGFASATKLSAAALGLPGLLALAIVARSQGGGKALRQLVIALVAVFVTFRLASPFSFAGPGVLDLAPSPQLLADLRKAVAFTADPNMPSNLQWIAGYPLAALLRDLVLFGFGPAVVAGLALSPLVRRTAALPEAVVLSGAALAHLGLALMTGYAALRYFAPAVPLTAILAGGAIAAAGRLPAGAVLAGAVYWASGSIALHDGAHPRLAATEWMRGLPTGTAIAFETDWDERLPMARFPPFKAQVAPPPPGPFTHVPLRITDPETAETPRRLADALARADHVAISSGRQIEVLPRLPDRFATATRFYAGLTSGALCFRRVFQSDRGFPLLFGRLDDRFAQEPWRVYDHPVVSIWEKQPCFSRDRALHLLSASS